MHWTNIGLILVAGFDLGLSLLIWLKNPKNKINISLAVAIVFLAVWTLGSGLMREAQDTWSAMFWGKFLNVGGITLIIPFFFFTLYFPYQSYVLSVRAKALIFLSMVSVLVILFYPNWYLLDEGITLSPHSNNYHFNHGYKIFVVYFLFYIIWAYVNLYKKYRTSQGYVRFQLKYILAGTGIISFFGTIFGTIAPLFTEGKYFWIGPYFALPMIVILTYFVFYYKAK